jgi:hypothetical protein
MNLHRRRALGGLLLLLSSCSSAPTDPAPGGEQDLSDVIYVGGVTDEALVRLLDGAPKNDARQALEVHSPDLSAPLPKDSPATFEYHLASETTRAPGPRVTPATRSPAKWQRAFHELLQLLAPVRVAHAHGAAFNGTAYYLVFSDADAKPRLQVFTTGTSYTPEAADWQRLAEAAQPLALDITWAAFEANDIPAGSGPFVGGKFPFRIE